MIDFLPSLALIYTQFGEPVTVAGAPVTAIFEGGYIAALDVQSTAPALRCRASDVPTVAVGATVVRAGVMYLVRSIEPVAPDEIERRLVLERQ